MNEEKWAWPVLAFLLCLLAVLRPIDHDESQYVAAAVLTAHGLLPYRDYAYLQTPLQPFLLAPLASAAGLWAWPALRLANALFGAVAIRCAYGAAREIAPHRAALAGAALFGCTDILLFSVGTARNDALPAACLAAALWLAVRAEAGRGTRLAALTTGLLLASAAAAKVSYVLPAAAYGGWSLWRWRAHRPLLVAFGAVPVVVFVAWTWWLSPIGFRLGVFAFPALAPADYYADRPWKLSWAAKLLDTAKFLALGPALLALILVLRHRRSEMLLALILAGLIAAVLPTPTWRQYLLPTLPPLFVLLAARWAVEPPGRLTRILTVVFATAGLAPTVAALASGRPGMVAASRYGAALGTGIAATGAAGPVATLSPQFLPASGRLPDARFASGPFWFRNRTLVAPGGEGPLHLLSRRQLPCAVLPALILVGGEGPWTSGDADLDRVLEAAAILRGYRARPVAGTPFRLYIHQLER